MCFLIYSMYNHLEELPELQQYSVLWRNETTKKNRMEFEDADEKDSRTTTNQIFSYLQQFSMVFSVAHFSRVYGAVILSCLCFAYYTSSLQNYDLFQEENEKQHPTRDDGKSSMHTLPPPTPPHRWFVIGKLFFMKSQSPNPFTHTHTLTDIHNQLNRKEKEEKNILFHKRSAMADKLKGK